MAEEKKVDLTSSLVDLKAELFRKQQQFKKEKNRSGGAPIKGKTVEKKPTIWSLRNTGVTERAQKDLESKKEEESAWEKSRSSLEAKAKLYEKMTQGDYIPEEENDERILVDFQRKSYEAISQKRHEERQKKEVDEEERDLSNPSIPPPSDPGEEWVDYVDSLGRSRRCMKKDLPDLINMDKKLSKGKRDDLDNTDLDSKPSLMSSDMYREMLRQKWEKEALEDLNKPVGDVHYANVQFDEIRTHGVGYYKFAKDEATRQQQMETLGKLRDQTQEQRSKRELIKEKKKAQLQLRLAKVRQRKGIKEEEKEPEAEIQEGNESMIGPDVIEKWTEDQTVSERDIEDKRRTMAPVREWDKGKKSLESSKQLQHDSSREPEFAPPDNYFDCTIPKKRIRPDPRDERLEEFAPPQSYYQQKSTKSWKKNYANNTQQVFPNSGKGKADTLDLNKMSCKKNQSVQINREKSKSEVETVDHSEQDLSNIPLPPSKATTNKSTTEHRVENPIPLPAQSFFSEPQQQFPNPFASQVQSTEEHTDSSPFAQYPAVNIHREANYGTLYGMQTHQSQSQSISEQFEKSNSQYPYQYSAGFNSGFTHGYVPDTIPPQYSHLSDEEYKRLVRKLPSSLPTPPTTDQPLPVYPSQADPYSWDQYQAPAAKPIGVDIVKKPVEVDRSASAFTVTEIQVLGDFENSNKNLGQEKAGGGNKVSRPKWRHGAAAENAQQSSEAAIGETLKYFRQLNDKKSNVNK